MRPANISGTPGVGTLSAEHYRATGHRLLDEQALVEQTQQCSQVPAKLRMCDEANAKALSKATGFLNVACRNIGRGCTVQVKCTPWIIR